jgi:hypothetical protein
MITMATSFRLAGIQNNKVIYLNEASDKRNSIPHGGVDAAVLGSRL